MVDSVENFFHFKDYGTNFKTETLAGLTTFITMSYILFVNPQVMGMAGMPQGPVFTATALVTAFGCILMGLLANYPFAISVSLGLNSFFAYSVCIGMGISWQTALAGVFVASILFIILTALKLREKIINAIPADLKYAIGGGIGLFIAFIGLSNGKIIIPSKDTLVTLGSFTNSATLLAIAGLVITLVLMSAKIPGAVFFGMILTAVTGVAFGAIALPHAVVAGIPSIKPIFLTSIFNLGKVFTPKMIIVVLTYLLIMFFDTAGTLVGLSEQAGYMVANRIPRIGKALQADSTTALVGSLLGTSPVGVYVESSSGIAVGGRTGFTVIITGILFLLATFFSPLLAVVTPSVTAPALVVVGILMSEQLSNIQWNKFEVAAPAFITLLTMPLTYSIADGIALGFIIYPITMIAAKKWKEVGLINYALAIIFVAFLALLNVK